jgi:hypothetical protein
MTLFGSGRALACGGFLLFVACQRSNGLKQACVSDLDCGPHRRCGVAGQFTGQCLCADDLACPNDAGPEFCNPLGLCQAKVGCFSNADCGGTDICNTRSALCVPMGSCGSDIDCPFGQYCPASHLCTPGCHSSSDCGMNGGQGVACLCPDGNECICPPDGGPLGPDPSYDRSLCTLGTCRSDTCAGDTSLCNTGQSCLPAATDGGLSTCEPDPRLNILCQNCLGTFHPGQANPCSVPGSTGANFCLLDPLSNGSQANCGVDCNLGQGCPSGYQCDDVLILTGSICRSDQDCVPPGAQTCSSSAQCPVDSQCTLGQPPHASGLHCGGYCTGAEGAQTGFCTCVQDSDCPIDTCDSTGVCRITQQPCIPGSQNSCGALRCIDVQGTKLCLIGRNCYPSAGLRCPPPSRQ